MRNRIEVRQKLSGVSEILNKICKNAQKLVLEIFLSKLTSFNHAKVLLKEVVFYFLNNKNVIEWNKIKSSKFPQYKAKAPVFAFISADPISLSIWLFFLWLCWLMLLANYVSKKILSRQVSKLLLLSVFFLQDKRLHFL